MHIIEIGLFLPCAFIKLVPPLKNGFVPFALLAFFSELCNLIRLALGVEQSEEHEALTEDGASSLVLFSSLTLWEESRVLHFEHEELTQAGAGSFRMSRILTLWEESRVQCAPRCWLSRLAIHCVL